MNINLIQIMQKGGLESEQIQYLSAKFEEYVDIATSWDEKAKNIVVIDESQVQLMDLAKKGRIELTHKRTDIEKLRKQLKDRSLKEGRAIDEVAKQLTSLIVPIEEYLKSQEKFVEIRKAEREAKLRTKRIEMLKPFNPDLMGVDVGIMTEERFLKFLQITEKEYNDKLEKERLYRDEQKRIILENEKILLENERIRKELEEKRKTEEENERLKQVIENSIVDEIVDKNQKLSEKNIQYMKNIRTILDEIDVGSSLNPDMNKILTKINTDIEKIKDYISICIGEK
jgi:hypothetical protein